jgi:hypothetical protein
MTHHDNANNKKRLKCQVPQTTVGSLPDANTIEVSDQAFGHDDIPFVNIGKRHGKAGFFKVTLRFATNADAVAQLTTALNGIGKGTEAVAYVLAVNRPSGDVDPATPPAEIEIDW